ncbi:hypothetical protein PFLUV_G00168940 [Perca fluviatilis]|uniref:Ig-like domain-containing protein n=1 Tax=Perca fluviatilis TaxID=8168 RepID=A0A6A5EPB9_PERFL|nr:hypothetical protein PFLUV_G00168940 [Perca fluviatilis]
MGPFNRKIPTMIKRSLYFPDLPQVIGSLQPIVAPLGGDVILPCHVEPQLNVEEMTVEWWRVDIKLDTRDPQSDYRYVHRYHDKQHKEDMKKLMYAGRTEMFTDGLKHGNISLKISNVMCFDQGSYRCQIPQLERASVIKITVALPVQQLQILMTFIGLLVSSSGEKC